MRYLTATVLNRLIVHVTLLLLVPLLLLAHVPIPIDDITSRPIALREFFYLGFIHILPAGLDHIFFITTVFFQSRSVRQIVKYSLIFTVAHSITLALVALDLIVSFGEVAEVVIAISIIVMAADLIRPFIPGKSKGLVIFIFGLFHGMGFATMLSEIGLARGYLIESLFGFNVGVEAGQLTVISLLYFATLLPFRNDKVRRGITLFVAGLIIFLTTLTLYYLALDIMERGVIIPALFE